MICDYCFRDVPKTYRGPDGEPICLECKRDVDYCAAKGQIPQNPEKEG
jgi:hypothetical protein